MIATQSNPLERANVSSDQTLPADTLDAMFASALTHHVAEEWQAAERLYRDLLAIDANQPAVYYNLAMLKWQTNQQMASLMHFKQAIAGNAQESTYWVSYVDALMQTGQHQYAREVLMRGLEQGLHGEAVNALVDQLTAPVTQKIPAAAPTAAMISPPAAVTNQAAAVPNPPAEPPLPAKAQKRTTRQHHTVDRQLQQALALVQSGQFEQAKPKLKRLLTFYPAHPALLSGLGTIAVQQGEMGEGISLLTQSLQLDPAQTTALSVLSVAYAALERHSEAIACCNRAIAINPDYAEAYVNRGNAQKALKQFAASVESYLAAIALQADHADGYFNLATVYKEMEQYALADKALRESLRRNPRDENALYVHGGVLHARKHYEEAITAFSQSLALSKAPADIYMARGLSYLAAKQLAHAANDFRASLALVPQSAEAHMNLAVALHKMNRVDEAISLNEKAIALNPRYSGAYINQSQYLQEKHQYQQALQNLEQAIRLGEEVVMATWHQSTIYLLLGDFKRGWALYESRKAEFAYSLARHFQEPAWTGEQPLAGKTLLIYKEQGFGDNIQFCRYAHLAQAQGARVILETPKELMGLMRTLADEITVVEHGSLLPAFDYQCSIMSLPLAFKTSVESIPAYAQYLYPEQKKYQHWQDALGTKTRLRVGLAWTGSTLHNNDHTRSVSLAALQTLFSVPVDFHSLQKEIRADDAARLADCPSLAMHGDALHDFSDTAALIASMDLVISVDTSVAHLAAAMGKPCWIMLSFAPEFRWMLAREDSPWYPSVRLFRQASLGDWPGVLADIKTNLAQYINEKKCIN